MKLYELVGVTYISMNWSRNVYIFMQVGVAVIGEWKFGECPFGKNMWCPFLQQSKTGMKTVLFSLFS